MPPPMLDRRDVVLPVAAPPRVKQESRKLDGGDRKGCPVERGARGGSNAAQRCNPLLQDLLCEDRAFSHEAVSLATPEMPPPFGGE